MVTARKKAVAWAVWALGNDQSVGIGIKSSSDSGRGLRKISLVTWVAITVTVRLRPSDRASRDLPIQIRKRARMAEEGRRKYNEPSQVMAIKKESQDI